MIENWISSIQKGDAPAAIAAFFLHIIIAFVPAAPTGVVASIIGTVFSFNTALFINWIGASMGAILMFLLSRFLFQKHTERYINRHRLSKHIFAFLSTHGFLSVLTVRLLPIFPSTLLNLVASISKIPVSSFCFGTILGKLPTMLAFTFAGQQWKQNPWIAFFFIGVYVLLLFWLTKKIRLYVLQTKNAKE